MDVGCWMEGVGVGCGYDRCGRGWSTVVGWGGVEWVVEGGRIWLGLVKGSRV